MSTDLSLTEARGDQEFYFVIGPAGERTVLTPAYFEVTGFSADEIQRTDFRTQVHPGDLALVERTREENLRGISTQITYRSLRKDGTVLWLELHAQPILDAGGALERIICRARTVRDPEAARESPPSRAPANIRVLIVDDHAVLRTGLRMLLTAQPDMTVVGEAADGAKAVELARTTRPDVVTLDLNMPGVGGLATMETLKKECPASRVLVLTMHDDAAYLKAAVAAGGAGYVTKTADESELLGAIRAVSQGRSSFSLSMNDGLVRALLGGEIKNPSAPAAQELSEREREVLALVAQGYTSQKIADRLYLSVKTIETYRARLMKKLGLDDRAQLVQFAIETGLLGPSQPIERSSSG
jgi:two-component system response regulator NreC